MHAQEFLMEFHFIKNDHEDFVKEIPIHALKVWVHELMMVIFMLEDLGKKLVVDLICLIDRISNELSLNNAKKGFQFKELKDKTAQNIHDH
jgi:hypothetical protein